jgi:hypothetical protein
VGTPTFLPYVILITHVRGQPRSAFIVLLDLGISHPPHLSLFPPSSIVWGTDLNPAIGGPPNHDFHQPRAMLSASPGMHTRRIPCLPVSFLSQYRLNSNIYHCSNTPMIAFNKRQNIGSGESLHLDNAPRQGRCWRSENYPDLSLTTVCTIERNWPGHLRCDPELYLMTRDARCNMSVALSPPQSNDIDKSTAAPKRLRSMMTGQN